MSKNIGNSWWAQNPRPEISALYPEIFAPKLLPTYVRPWFFSILLQSELFIQVSMCDVHMCISDVSCMNNSFPSMDNSCHCMWITHFLLQIFLVYLQRWITHFLIWTTHFLVWITPYMNDSFPCMKNSIYQQLLLLYDFHWDLCNKKTNQRSEKTTLILQRLFLTYGLKFDNSWRFFIKSV